MVFLYTPFIGLFGGETVESKDIIIIKCDMMFLESPGASFSVTTTNNSNELSHKTNSVFLAHEKVSFCLYFLALPCIEISRIVGLDVSWFVINGII
jgi:hypothetical protein